jgi:hypothetical protein
MNVKSPTATHHEQLKSISTKHTASLMAGIDNLELLSMHSTAIISKGFQDNGETSTAMHGKIAKCHSELTTAHER